MTTFTTFPQFVVNEQPSLIPHRISSRFDNLTTGRELPFLAFTGDGGKYFAKQDRDHRPVRATEWICTKLARHVGIETAECVILDDDLGNTFFGSQAHDSVASDAQMRAFMLARQFRRPNELSTPVEWLGDYLSGLRVLDLFLSNGDRYPINFVLTPEGAGHRLRAIDFASANLDGLSTDRFPVEPGPPFGVGKFLREFHGKSISAALEMVDRIAAVRLEVIEGILRPMPDDWLSTDKKRGIREDWANLGSGVRLPALRAGIVNEKLL